MVNSLEKYVNLIIKDHVIRYTVSQQPELNSIIDYGERYFSETVIEDGKIIDEEKVQLIIDQLVSEKKWENRHLRFCVPDTAVMIREQLVPKGLTKQEIKSYLHMEVEESGNIHLPFANPVIDFELLGEEDEQVKILLFAYPMERMTSFVNIFKKAGLQPVIADVSSLSLYRLYHHLDRVTGQENLLTVQCDKDVMVLTAFNHAKPVFTRNIRSSLSKNSWTWQMRENELKWVGEKQEIERYLQDQLITVERFMDFYQFSVMDGRERITKVLLAGDYPYLAELKEMMKEQWEIVTESMDEYRGILPLPAKFADIAGLSIKKRNT